AMHERAVDLERVDRQAREAAQGGIAGAKIVDRELHAVSAQLIELLHARFDIVHQHAFGDLQIEPYLLRPELADGAHDDFDEIRAAQLRRRDVDGHSYVRQALFDPGGPIACGAAQCPGADLLDQTQRFEHWYDLPGRDDALLRVSPA